MSPNTDEDVSPGLLGRWLGRLGADWSAMLARFWPAFAAAGAATAIMLAASHELFDFDDTVRPLTAALLAMTALTAARLLTEGRAGAWYGALALAALGLVAARVWTLGERPYGDVVVEPALFLGPALVLLVMVAATPRLKADNDGFWEFNWGLWFGVGLGLVAAGVLTIGISAAFFAIDTLFAADIPGWLFGDVWILAFGLLWPAFALAGIPREPTAGECTAPWALAPLARWVLVPLVMLYGLILYAYTVKVLVTWQVPEGEVAGLVSGFAIFGTMVWLAIYPLRLGGGPVVALFWRWFQTALLVPVGLLAVAVWLRIDAYGVTESRYLLALFTVWLGLGAVLFSFRRRPPLALVPGLLALLLMAASFGPWGAVGLSVRSQFTELRQVLEEQSIVVDGKLAAGPVTLEDEDWWRVRSIVDYLADKGEGERIMAWLPEGTAPATTTSRIMYVLGVVRATATDGPNEYFQFDIPFEQPFDAAGFDRLYNVSITVRYGEPLAPWRASDGFEVSLADSRTTLELRFGADTSATVALAPVLAALRDPARDGDWPAHATLERAGQGWHARIHVTRVVGFTAGGNDVVQGLEMMVLVAEP